MTVGDTWDGVGLSTSRSLFGVWEKADVLGPEGQSDQTGETRSRRLPVGPPSVLRLGQNTD